MLAPRVDVFDANKAQRRSLGLADLKSRGDSLAVDVFINNDNADERYLVLYPDPSAFGHGESRSSMGMQTTYIATGLQLRLRLGRRVEKTSATVEREYITQVGHLPGDCVTTTFSVAKAGFFPTL